MAGKPITIEFEFRNKRFADAEQGLRAFVDTLGKDWDGAARTLKRELLEFLETIAEALAKRHGNPWPSGTTDQTLSVRSGDLIKSIKDSVRVEGDAFENIVGWIGADFPARTHEYGAVITAKNVQYLTIPLPAALDHRGLPLKEKARDWPNTFVAKSKKGNLIIFQRQGTTIVPLYLLKTSVTIPARLGMRQTIETGIPYFVEKAMDSMVRDIAGQGEQ